MKGCEKEGEKETTDILFHMSNDMNMSHVVVERIILKISGANLEL